MINIYEANIDNYKKEAINAINSGWISNHGEYINLATNKLNEVLNCNYSILLSNGTCATHCLFLSLKFKYPEINKIYVPNNAYVAAWNSALMVYNLQNLEVMKMDLDKWNIETNEDYIKSLEKDSAVLIVHNLGNIINVPRLKKIRLDLIFVEDNCEGLFGKYDGIFSGTSEDTLCSSLSFYGNKTITTGEGGAFLTNHKDIYEYIKKVYSQGMSSQKYLHDVHAYNYRMTNIQSAFLYEQLNYVENILNNKNKIFKNYEILLENLIKNEKIALFKKEENTENANWIFAIRIINNKKSIDETNEFFKINNIDVRPFFYPINQHKHLNKIENKDEVSEVLNKEIIMIPSSPNITIKQQTCVVDIIEKFIKYMEKKNVAFIISGQSREIDFINHSKFIFTKELNTFYNYDIFIVVDNIDKKKYFDYFGDKLKSIICTDTDIFIDEYCNINNIKKNLIHTNLLFSSFRTKIAFKLMEKEGKQYDYIVKMRPDLIIYNNILNNLKLLDILPNRQIYFIWDMCLIGRFDIMKYFCNLYNNLPVEEKENNLFIHNGLLDYDNYKNWSVKTPETQICELLMKYIKNNNMSIDESLKDSHINCSLVNRNFTHHGNNNFPDNYYYLCEDYKLLLDNKYFY
jgi:perosamine synthetase